MQRTIAWQGREGRLPVEVARWLTAERVALLVLAALVALAVLSRFWDLGTRALHHDESLHAFYSYQLYDEGIYRHDPLMHGPLLFHLTALGFWLFGDSDFTSRLVPALLGVILVWAPWKFRPWLGTRGALATSALILISPTLLYYSRFIREDIFFAAWTVIIVYGMWQYLAQGREFHLYLMMAGWALAFSQKEVSFLLAAVLWSYLLVQGALHWRHVRGRMALSEMREWHLLVAIGALLLPHASALVLHLLHRDPAGGYNEATYKSVVFIQQAGLTTVGLFLLGTAAAALLWDGRRFLRAAAVFYAIFVFFHTTMLTWPFGIGSGMVGALGYWIEQHGVERGSQPWYYYVMLTPLYEFLPLLVGVGGLALVALRRRLGPLVAPGAEAPHLNTRALWPLFNLWWLSLIFVVLSYAGEKMPWLLVHIALPLAFLGGWALGRVMDGVDGREVARRGGLRFSLFVALALLAAGAILWMALRSEWPFQGTDAAALARSARWLGSLLLLALASWGLIRTGDRLGKRGARQVALLTVSALLALATVRFAVIASFRNADDPHEPLIYTQTAPDMVRLMRQIEMMSERMTGGRDLKVAYDSTTSWPFQWYLRNYPNKFYFGSSPESYTDQLRESAIVLVGTEHNNDQKVRPLLSDWIRHEYVFRPNFIEDYKNLMQVYQVQPDPVNPDQTIRTQTGQSSEGLPTLLGNLGYLAQQPQARRDFTDFFVHRQGPVNPYGMWVYVNPEVAAEVWQYGVNVTAMDPDLVRDPYAEVRVELAPTAILDRPGDFASPKNVAVLPDGTLAVADSGNHRIRIVERDGTPIRDIGSFGAAAGQFNEPWGIAAAPDGTFYVADTWNHRVQHLNVEGEVLHVWGGFADTGGQLTQEGSFWGPRGVAVDAEGRVYVTDTGNKRVQRFDAEGNFLDQVGGSGVGPGQFAEPVGVAVAPDGTIFVADTWNRRIQSFAPDWAPLRQLPVRAWSGQSITNKPFIAASDERLWISDPESYRLIELDREGEPLRVWGQFGSDLAALNLPLGLSFDGETLWVADSENQRVLGYTVAE